MSEVELTYFEMSNLTGFAYRTIKKRLANLTPRKTGRGVFFDSKIALKTLYSQPDDEDLDLAQERAKLARAQTDAAEIKNRVSRGELIEADQVKNSALKTGVMVRTALQAIPNKVAPVLVDLDTPAAIADVINREVNQILSKLSDEIRRIG